MGQWQEMRLPFLAFYFCMQLRYTGCLFYGILNIRKAAYRYSMQGCTNEKADGKEKMALDCAGPLSAGVLCGGCRSLPESFSERYGDRRCRCIRHDDSGTTGADSEVFA